MQTPFRRRWFPFFLLWLAAPDAPAPAPLAWPLDLTPHAITGTFMEPRSAHYHSGLDLKTEGRIGVRVLAPAAGSVVRVRVSPHGYGKALYLLAEDGRTLVFAHLSRFADPIQERITTAQRVSGRYTQDLYLQPGELRVAPGDLVALSGATGTGAPHLHFEVRDAQERPLNPILAGLTVPDERAPTVLGFRLVPLAAESRIQGQPRSVEVEPGGAVAATGRVGLQLEVEDHTGIFNHRLMPFSVELRVDGRRHYLLEQRVFAFSQGRQMRLEIVPGEGRRRWLRLYPHGPNRLPHRSGPGTWVASPGQTVEVIVADAAGHRARAGITIGATSLAPGREAVWPYGEALLSFAGAPGDVLQIRAPGLGLDRLRLDAGGHGALALDRLGSGRVEAVGPGGTASFTLLRGGDAVDALALIPGALWVTDPTGQGTFAGGALWAEAVAAPEGQPAGTEVMGEAYRLHGTGLAFQDHLRVDLRGPPAPQTAVCVVDARGRWTALPTTTMRRDDGAPVWRVEVDELGVLVPLRDAEPPRLGPFEVDGRRVDDGVGIPPLAHRDRDGVTLPRWPALEIPVADLGVGIPDHGVTTSLDGAPFPARWDPEAERVAFDWYVDPGPGEHLAQVRVVDEVGNHATLSLRFHLR